MNVLLTAINAKYIHTNLAVRSLKQYAAAQGFPCEFAEYSINQPFDAVLGDLYRRGPEVAAFSCYLWNIEFVLALCRELKKVLPRVRIWLGGPEVSYDCGAVLTGNPDVDLIMRGEGEEIFTALLRAVSAGEPPDAVNGIVFRCGDETVRTPDASAFDLSRLPFAYDDLDSLSNRIVYFESSRGCPFRCGYCLSSLSGGVRFLPVETACTYLDRFLEQKVRQVKFVDRTFNCDRKHADAILSHLIARDNGYTNFHFEISADILAGSTIELIGAAREGLFQFEAGVQSTNPRTLSAVGRRCENQKLFEKLRLLRGKSGAHLHLDLIAGLPFEDYASFARSYDEVFAVKPDMLQLGFLKVLKGSRMRRDAAACDIVYQSRAPYEVLSTGWMSYGELLELKRISSLNDVYQNSGRFVFSLGFILRRYASPFRFFEELSGYFLQNGLFERSIGKFDHYLHLLRFYTEKFGAEPRLNWLMKHDILSRERAKGIPKALNPSLRGQYRAFLEGFWKDPENLHRYAPEAAENPRAAGFFDLEVYPFSVFTGAEKAAAVLYDYRGKNAAGNARTIEIPLA